VSGWNVDDEAADFTLPTGLQLGRDYFDMPVGEEMLARIELKETALNEGVEIQAQQRVYSAGVNWVVGFIVPPCLRCTQPLLNLAHNLVVGVVDSCSRRSSGSGSWSTKTAAVDQGARWDCRIRPS
jgi:hypothetical protein